MANAERAAGFIIFRRLSEMVEYLLMQTSYGEHHWTPPKGHVEREESDLQTAYRETQEEAGFLAEDLKVYNDCKMEITYNVKGRPKTVIYWLAELINKTKPVTMSHEHQNFKWLPLNDAKELSRYADLQMCMATANDYIIQNLSKDK